MGPFGRPWVTYAGWLVYAGAIAWAVHSFVTRTMWRVPVFGLAFLLIIGILLVGRGQHLRRLAREEDEDEVAEVFD